MNIMVNLNGQKNVILKNLSDKLYKAGLYLEGEVKKIVAIDTGLLHDSISTSPVMNYPKGLYVEVGTEDIDYAKYVEYGVGKTYNYHRGGSVVYTGDGQHYLERAKNDNMDEIINILKQ